MNQGCKIKFTAIIKKLSPSQDLIDQLNDTMNDPMSEISQLNTMSCMISHR